MLGIYYHSKYRVLRKVYKWSPDVVDAIELSRLCRIFDECIEDLPKKGDLDPDELEG